jgi:hypothetical protein
LRLFVRRRTYRIALLAVVLFLFFVPVFPTSVSRYSLLPTRNQCFGLIENLQYEPVITSISYVAVGFLFGGTIHDGAFGLVYVPDNGVFSVQFPPLGFVPFKCQ